MNTYKVKVREWTEKEIIVEAPNANACNDLASDNLKILSIEITRKK